MKLLLLFFLCTSIKISPVAGQTTKVVSQTSTTSIQKIEGVTALEVEKSFKETKYAYVLFKLINEELELKKTDKSKFNEFAGQIYWKIMNEFANQFNKEKINGKNLKCIEMVYTSKENSAFIKISTPGQYDNFFNDTVLKERKWTPNPAGPTEDQLNSVLVVTGMGRQILANIARIMNQNSKKLTTENGTKIYQQISFMFRSLLFENGATKATFQKVVDTIKQEDCQKYFLVVNQYASDRGLNIIKDKIQN